MTDLVRLWTWPLATLFVVWGALMTIDDGITPITAATLLGNAEDAAVSLIAQEVADKLAGTCNERIEDHAPAHLLDDKAFLQELDALVFVCDTCGWWCRDEERSTAADMSCDECVPNTEDT